MRGLRGLGPRKLLLKPPLDTLVAGHPEPPEVILQVRRVWCLISESTGFGTQGAEGKCQTLQDL